MDFIAGAMPIIRTYPYCTGIHKLIAFLISSNAKLFNHGVGSLVQDGIFWVLGWLFCHHHERC
jgi:hypothetical protein